MVAPGKALSVRRRRIDPRESSPKRTPLFVREELFC